MAKFVIYKDIKSEYRWRFQANNNEIIAVSGEGYTQKQTAIHAIDLVKTLAYGAEVADQTAMESSYRLFIKR